MLALLYGVVYFVLAFRAVYGGPARRVILRAAGVAVAYFITMVLAVGVAIAAVILARR